MFKGFSLTTIEFSLLIGFILFIFIGLVVYMVRNSKQSAGQIDEEIGDQKSTKLRDDDLL